MQRLLRNHPDFEFSVSATTRPLRGQEVHGKDYYFLSPEEFRQKIETGAFLEYEEVYEDRFYGTLLSEVDRILEKGNSVVFDLDVQGGVSIKRHFGAEACAFFIQPPSLEALRSRLERRGTDSPEEIARRLAKAGQELEFAPQFDHVIVNDELDEAVQKVEKVIDLFLEKV